MKNYEVFETGEVLRSPDHTAWDTYMDGVAGSQTEKPITHFVWNEDDMDWCLRLRPITDLPEMIQDLVEMTHLADDMPRMMEWFRTKLSPEEMIAAVRMSKTGFALWVHEQFELAEEDNAPYWLILSDNFGICGACGRETHNDKLMTVGRIEICDDCRMQCGAIV